MIGISYHIDRSYRLCKSYDINPYETIDYDSSMKIQSWTMMLPRL